jgi:hypothetical protein
VEPFKPAPEPISTDLVRSVRPDVRGEYQCGTGVLARGDGTLASQISEKLWLRLHPDWAPIDYFEDVLEIVSAKRSDVLGVILGKGSRSLFDQGPRGRHSLFMCSVI